MFFMFIRVSFPQWLNFDLVGVWYIGFYLGSFVGPTIGGPVFATYGFHIITRLLMVAYGVSFMINTIELGSILLRKAGISKRRPEEEISLLRKGKFDIRNE